MRAYIDSDILIWHLRGTTWAFQSTPIFTVLSFLNLTKDPVSLLYLLMTIGPSLVALGWSEGRERGRVGRAFVMLGRVRCSSTCCSGRWPTSSRFR
jgi:uncharacterized membrane protein